MIKRLCVLVVATLFIACGDSTPVPGTVSISLETPNVDDGAIVLTLTGAGITSLEPTSSSYQMYQRLVTPGELRVVLFGNLSQGPLLTANVPDVNNGDGYSALIVQVASRSNELQDMAGYALSVETFSTGPSSSIHGPVSP